MKIAYIITAYKDAAQLKRLIRSLNHSADFYIHVDSKVDISPFENSFKLDENVFFSNNRFFINWGSFAQVLSQKELLFSVINSGKIYDRVACISGTDYPIWSNSKIEREFILNPKKEYIMGINLTNSLTVSQHARIRLFHFFRDIEIKHVLVKKLFSGSAREILRFSPFRKEMTTSIEGIPADIYLGSDYWALTFECAKYVYDKMCSEYSLMKYFKHSYVPSEMCVQTIIFNSSFSKEAILYDNRVYEGLDTLTPLHYIEYGKIVKIFTESDFDKLIDSGKMFFRKAITGKSDSLLDKIDLYRAESML